MHSKLHYEHVGFSTADIRITSAKQTASATSLIFGSSSSKSLIARRATLESSAKSRVIGMVRNLVARDALPCRLFSYFLRVKNRLCVQGGLRIWLFHFRSTTASRIEYCFRRGFSHFNFATAILINATVTLAYLHFHDVPGPDDDRNATVT